MATAQRCLRLYCIAFDRTGKLRAIDLRKAVTFIEDLDLRNVQEKKMYRNSPP